MIGFADYTEAIPSSKRGMNQANSRIMEAIKSAPATMMAMFWILDSPRRRAQMLKLMDVEPVRNTSAGKRKAKIMAITTNTT